MNVVKLAFKYLKKYPKITAATLLSITAASIFEGASFGMLIPLIQNMTGTGTGLVENTPFIRHMSFVYPQHLSISVILTLLFLIIIIKNMFSYISNVLITKLRFGVSRDLSVELMDNVISYDLKYFDSVKTGHIISTLSNETRRIGDFMQAVLQMITLAVRISVFIALMFFISAKASIIIFVLMAVVLLPLELIMKKVKVLSAASSVAYLGYTHKLTELLSGIRVIKTNVTEGSEKRSFAKDADLVYRSMLDATRHIYAFVPLSEVLIFGLIVMTVLALINFVKVDIASTFPFIATYLVVMVRMLTQLNSFNSTRSSAVNNIAAFKYYEEMKDPHGKRMILGGSRKIDRLRDSIEFRNVCFSYDGRRRVIEDISLKILKGKITAIIGMSGSGKSTIVNLISRLYEIDSGTILVDGIDLKEMDLDEWRKRMGFVSQDTFIFNTNVKDNIAYGRAGVSEDDVVEAARVAHAHDFIMGLSQGYDTVLGERGIKLSGGQKQRISIARAVLKNPDILILDEATSSVDTDTERAIKASIDSLTRNRTVIAIAHRLSTIVNADNIIVLENGMVVESGPHAELVKRSGLYKHLYDLQFNIKGICGQEAVDYAR